MHSRLMDVGSSLVERVDEEFDEPIYLRLVVIMIGYFERVVEEYVS